MPRSHFYSSYEFLCASIAALQLSTRLVIQRSRVWMHSEAGIFLLLLMFMLQRDERLRITNTIRCLVGVSSLHWCISTISCLFPLRRACRSLFNLTLFFAYYFVSGAPLKNRPKGRFRNWPQLIVFAFAELIGGFTFSLLSPFYTEVATAKGLSVSETGLVSALS